MKITKYGHCCMLVEEGSARLLIDPGGFSQGFENLTDLTAILITHEHGDHFDLDKVKALLANNSSAHVICDVGTAEILSKEGIQAQAVKHGDIVEPGRVKVAVFGEWHAPIHPSLPKMPNIGFLIAGRFFHPGDAFTNPEEAVELLGLPAAAPWAKVSESIDYANEIKPKIAIPMHEKVSAAPEMMYTMIQSALAEGIELVVIEDGQTKEL
jgi:L-ascorbate metabolism protein UlaG (beta-lactamase superfamily)